MKKKQFLKMQKGWQKPLIEERIEKKTKKDNTQKINWTTRALLTIVWCFPLATPGKRDGLNIMLGKQNGICNFRLRPSVEENLQTCAR